MPATLFQPEPSAKAPCTSTTFLMCFMTIPPPSFELQRSCIEPRTCDHHSQERAQYYCKHEPLLSNPAQNAEEGGRKDYSGLEFNARTPAESQVRDDMASRDDSGQHPLGR